MINAKTHSVPLNILSSVYKQKYDVQSNQLSLPQAIDCQSRKDTRNYITKPGLEVIKLFYFSAQLSLIFILLINVKMPTIFGILTFISMINIFESLKARIIIFFTILVFMSLYMDPKENVNNNNNRNATLEWTAATLGFNQTFEWT